MKTVRQITGIEVVILILIMFIATMSYFNAQRIVELHERYHEHVSRSAHPRIRMHMTQIEDRLEKLDGVEGLLWPPQLEP